MKVNWHQQPVNDIFKEFSTNPDGLVPSAIEERLQKYGRNQLVEKKKKSKFSLFLNQFKDVMILILLAAAVVSGIVGDLKDTIVISIIVLLNAIVGFVQEYRAEQAIEALKKLSATQATVRRNGAVRKIPAEELVPGDLVLLEAGDMVPADLRLSEVHSLKIGEASLTGESQAVEKHTDPMKDAPSQLGDRVNMAYKTTLVINGRGTGIVVATGMETEIGRIAKMLQGKETQTSLQIRLADFAKKLSVIVLVICIVLFVSGLLRGEPAVNMLLVSISLAVAAIPEALPAVVTISLAMGARKLVRQNALVRKLAAVETLGSVTFICTDKTGTLTQNKMVVREAWRSDVPVPSPFSGEDFLLFCMLSNQDTKREGDQWVGDPTEVALINYALENGMPLHALDTYERIFELPFDSDRKMMTTVHHYNDQYLSITKGGIEFILEHCTGTGKEKIMAGADEAAARGMRMLGYGYRILHRHPQEMSMQEIENDLQFAGYAGLLDPPRPEARKAVEDCIGAGIVPVMITGDHPATAKAIATEIGIMHLPTDKVYTGVELAKLSEKEFEKEIEDIKVYARVNPEQKLLIVQTLQKKKHFVSMTGDGVNDAPALKQANIGVAMGITGTDVSKESSHMILLDDNFATIVKAVKEGRRIFDNIRKFIRYIMTGNSSEIWTLLLAPLIGLPIPLLPIHILWINLVTDGLPALALAKEPAEKNIMQRPPRPPDESIFAGGLGLHVLWVGLLMGGLCLGIQAWALHEGMEGWQTMVFSTLCFSQMAHVMAIRSDHFFLYRQGITSNLLLAGAVLLTFLLQLALIYIPLFNDIFSTTPLSLKQLLVCLGAAVVVFHAVEVEKLIRRKR